MFFSSEFYIIRRIARGTRIFDDKVVRGIGDDCAVIDRGKYYEIISTDAVVEGDHFSLEWSTSQQVGRKSFESNVSDIAAMGGVPKYVFVSLVLRRDTPSTFVDGFYKGFQSGCEKYRISLLGGNIAHGREISATVTIIGEVSKKLLCLRSGAKIGDFICATGPLGASMAGLLALRKFGSVSGALKAGIPRYVLAKHLEPRSRMDIVSFIAQYATSMIDVSDGLASEVRHICEASGVGAEVYAEKIPIHSATKKSARILKKNPLDFALSGGEDFELIFTVHPKNFAILRKKFSFLRKNLFYFGVIHSPKKGIFFLLKEKKVVFPEGFDHFSTLLV
ncbi:thiamine-phosphate kinase [Candidatus Peregrinibacteria bacterium]|nr:thiamine-phosphate kinase [Candidatus Peregrinibacteria bacterium]